MWTESSWAFPKSYTAGERLHRSCVEFKWQMSKTRLWWFKFGISGFYGNVNEG